MVHWCFHSLTFFCHKKPLHIFDSTACLHSTCPARVHTREREPACSPTTRTRSLLRSPLQEQPAAALLRRPRNEATARKEKRKGGRAHAPAKNSSPHLPEPFAYLQFFAVWLSLYPALATHQTCTPDTPTPLSIHTLPTPSSFQLQLLFLLCPRHQNTNPRAFSISSQRVLPFWPGFPALAHNSAKSQHMYTNFYT